MQLSTSKQPPCCKPLSRETILRNLIIDWFCVCVCVCVARAYAAGVHPLYWIQENVLHFKWALSLCCSCCNEKSALSRSLALSLSLLNPVPAFGSQLPFQDRSLTSVHLSPQDVMPLVVCPHYSASSSSTHLNRKGGHLQRGGLVMSQWGIKKKKKKPSQNIFVQENSPYSNE